MHDVCGRINPIFSTVLSQNSKPLVIAQLHPRSTEHLMSNIHLHNTLQHAFSQHLQVQASPVHSNLEVSHLAHTDIDNDDNGSSLLFHRKQTGLQYV